MARPIPRPKLGHDVAMAVWGNLEQASPTDRVLQRAYIAQTRQLIADWANAGTKEAAEAERPLPQVFPLPLRQSSRTPGMIPLIPDWLRSYLPAIASRLDQASRKAEGEDDRSALRADVDRSRQVDRISSVAASFVPCPLCRSGISSAVNTNQHKDKTMTRTVLPIAAAAAIHIRGRLRSVDGSGAGSLTKASSPSTAARRPSSRSRMPEI